MRHYVIREHNINTGKTCVAGTFSARTDNEARCEMLAHAVRHTEAENNNYKGSYGFNGWAELSDSYAVTRIVTDYLDKSVHEVLRDRIAAVLDMDGARYEDLMEIVRNRHAVWAQGDERHEWAIVLWRPDGTIAYHNGGDPQVLNDIPSWANSSATDVTNYLYNWPRSEYGEPLEIGHLYLKDEEIAGWYGPVPEWACDKRGALETIGITNYSYDGRTWTLHVWRKATRDDKRGDYLLCRVDDRGEANEYDIPERDEPQGHDAADAESAWTYYHSDAELHLEWPHWDSSEELASPAYALFILDEVDEAK